MNWNSAAPGIRFNDCVFSEPRPLAHLALPRCGGLFAILAMDSNWAPKPFQVLYFGEFGNNAQQPLPPAEQMRLARAARGAALFACVLPIPFSTTSQRSMTRDQLIWAYNPPCQDGSTSAGSGELARKLEELQKKHEEQTTHFNLLVSNLNRLFEPHPDPPRRRQIGFLPQPATAD
jgi:hypothetical protein